ncbi:ABC transporter substrate-binding protein [Desulfosediminicola flagellatus]|uniref:ABC transporter substrate-binding protein n=1 Tax=Desulfosediminicola flagellatus TaxID=2569541 RepID=UPI0010AD917A|nr:ABC transporter substrate-binding protein [Desulfosediminicola flagellatus]
MTPTPTKSLNVAVFVTVLLLLTLTATAQAVQSIKIGLNFPLTGDLKDMGITSREGAEIVRAEVNAEGGLLIGDKRYPVEFIYADNESNVEKAVSGALNLISRENVLGIIGPCASSNAIPVGGISESFKIPMVSSTSTNPKTTLKRPFVFRACFLDSFQGEAMARFATKEFKAEKAAVLFDSENAYPRGLAEFFKSAFEGIKGPGSVVAYESYEADDSDLSALLATIVKSDADVLFVPQYAHELPNILKQIRAAGWKKSVLGGDAWEASDLMENCGDLCKGLYFSSHFAAVGAKGIAGDFVERYQAQTKQSPTAFGALAYDATKLMLKAISRVDDFTGNLFIDRAAVKEQLASIQGFQGVSGIVNMNASGDPAKSAVVIRITENGEFESYSSEAP